ncbi:hypothetical protein [Mycoplasma bradburyae]|uniref:Haemagglutinin Mycoplasma domain-containing protein n=1 Tax=Mycoplasma bradburyae TaxID=2963128 RepID=A0ABT5G9Y1_9MOLU|nr:hypothetical protein [Mycoplasma bradburyae]MDC4181757.1 hypothetical protein [Mycoplasma bradburyae]UTS69811.1 hypothetical protein NMG68_02175 [Mycoplasma bradburyae]
MKQKTKKLLQLSFSLGFLATTALVATSCKQPATVAPKPANPMQAGNGSGSGITTPGSGETTQPGNGSGSGTGATTPDNTEAKTQLESVIISEMQKLAMYDDYSTIKSTLAQAYNNAKAIVNKSGVTNDELTSAKSALEAAINKANNDKTKFDSDNIELVNAYKALKEKVASEQTSLALITESKYNPIKEYIANLFTQAKTIISDTLQANNKPDAANITNLKNNIYSVISKLAEEKQKLDEYLNFKLFKISDEMFSGDFKYTKKSANAQKIVGFSSDFNNDVDSGAGATQWRSAYRIIDKDETNSEQVTNVRWIYSLETQTGENKMPASFDISFEYYGGKTATLYLPYKLVKANQSNDNISLKYKLNDNEELKNVDVSKAKVDSIEVAKVQLTGLNFGNNKISFMTESGKSAPMIGNIYIAANDTTADAVYNNIFGNQIDSMNPNKITVDFAKGYGLANKGFRVISGSSNVSTNITKFTGKLEPSEVSSTYYLIGYLGRYAPNSPNNDANVRSYTFYVNVPVTGSYNISGYYNSGEDGRGLSFWKESFGATGEGNEAKFDIPRTANWTDTLKSFNENQKTSGSWGSLNLTKGLNKIIVSGKNKNKEAPNLGNVTFTLKENTTK